MQIVDRMKKKLRYCMNVVAAKIYNEIIINYLKQRNTGIHFFKFP